MTAQTQSWTRERYYFFMVLLLIVGLAWIAATRTSGPVVAGTPAPRPGFLAPDFELRTLEGSTIRLSDLRGRPVVINFWATWCPPCRTEMPAFVREYERYRDRGLVVLAVNQAEQPETVAAFRDAFQLTFPILLDPYMEVSEQYEIRFLPTTFFVNADGVISDMVTGGMSEAAVRARFQRLMEAHQP